MPLVDFHSFVPSAATHLDSRGHIRIECQVCGGVANAWRHRSRAAIDAAVAKRRGPRVEAVAWHELPPKQPDPPTRPLESLRPKAPAPRIADWRLTLLRLAIEQALEADISLALRLRLMEAQRALRSDLYGTVSHELPATANPAIARGRAAIEAAAIPPATASPPPGIAKDRAAAARQAARAFRGDKPRDIFLRAIDAGWTWRLLGSGHMRVDGPTGGFVISTTAIADRGHAFRNLKATAKRAGLDVDGL